MRQPINNPSRVPAYQNSRRMSGFCHSSVKPSNIGEGLVRVDVSFRSFLCAKENGQLVFFFEKKMNKKDNKGNLPFK